MGKQTIADMASVVSRRLFSPAICVSLPSRFRSLISPKGRWTWLSDLDRLPARRLANSDIIVMFMVGGCWGLNGKIKVFTCIRSFKVGKTRDSANSNIGTVCSLFLNVQKPDLKLSQICSFWCPNSPILAVRGHPWIQVDLLNTDSYNSYNEYFS